MNTLLTTKCTALASLIAVIFFAAGCATTDLSAPPPPPSTPPSPPQHAPARGQANTGVEYPAEARRAGQQGRVVVRVFVDTDGQPSQAGVHESSGYPLLDAAAVRGVSRWKFVPAKRDGVPRAMWFMTPITFSLSSPS